MDDHLTVRRLRVDGQPVECRIVCPPAGPGLAVSLPVLLLHGLGCSWEAWRPTLREAARRGLNQPVIVPDMPGFGCSPGPPEALGMDALADWTAHLLDALGVDRVHVAGNSMGCQVALALARRHPTRVGGLVLIGPTVGDHIVSFRRYLLGVFLDSFRESLRCNLVVCRMYAQVGLRRYLETVAKMMADDPLAHAAAMQTPVLVMRGEHDRIVPDWVARKLAARLPHGSFLRLPGAAHALEFSRPQEFLEVALEFWSSGRVSRPSSSRA